MRVNFSVKSVPVGMGFCSLSADKMVAVSAAGGDALRQLLVGSDYIVGRIDERDRESRG